MEYKRLNTLIKSLDETKRMAMSMYQEDSETEFRKHYLNLAMQMEKLTNQTRIATVLDADIDRRHYIATVKDELNITVRDLNGRIGISMPYLLPKNRSVDSESYIIEPLVCALQGFIEKHHPEKIRHALVIIRSVYTDDNKKLLRDNDNIEIHHVINIISTMLLVDDNMLDILLCSRVGKTTHTEIIISEKAENL
ncbi:MAG: hypothetical protein II059_02365 [Clostridia bacterium]|nr:hypothetical protein [Clostridia bacterium]